MANVLVVDDDADVRSFVGRVLGRLGYAITEAREGGEALRCLEGQAFDLVVSDVYMAEMDGMELLVRIKWRGLPVPVVMISGGGYKPKGEVLEMAASCGAVATLEKPFSPNELRAVVERLLAPRKG